MALAEYNSDMKDAFISSLNEKGISIYHLPKIGCQRIDLFSKYKPSDIERFTERTHYTILKIPHETLGFQIIAFVHFSSKLHGNDDDLLEEARLFKGDIEDIEKEIGNNKTVVVGDFNMNPFEKGMVSASAMHSIQSRKIASKNFRTKDKKNYSMFYNPMWNLFGDSDDIPGTYFYNSPHYTNYYWNIFDQVIIRPSLVHNFDLNSLRIIKEIENCSLVNINGIPSISDHLPIYFELH